MKRKVIQERFNNIDSLLDIMEKRPLNKAFENERLSSQVIDEGGWSGSETYSEAIDVMQKGYKKPLDEMKKAILKIGQMDKYQRPNLINSVVGFVPNVPNALMGLPETMINREPLPNRAKTIHLTYSFCASAKVKPEQIIQGGINFISLVNSLEKQGYRVGIDVVFITLSDKSASAVTVNLKQQGQTLNLLKLSFPLVHPAMLRRVAFKWLETTPELKDKGFNGSYGRPLGTYYNFDSTRETEFLKNHGILKGENTYYCNVVQAYKCKDIQELAKIMKIK